MRKLLAPTGAFTNGLLGLPTAIVTDNGTAFTSNAALGWTDPRGFAREHVQPVKPMRNGFTESIDGRLRDETLFRSLRQARSVLEASMHDCHAVRPHSRFGWLTSQEHPRRLAGGLEVGGDTPPDQARIPVADG